MINEANAVLGHHAAADQVAASWREVFPSVVRELRLPNGRIIDVCGGVVAGDLYMCEVKTTLKASLIEEAIEKYQRFANYLYVGVPCATEADLNLHVPLVGFPQPWHRVGIIGIYAGSIRILRTPSYRQVGRLDWCGISTAFRDAAWR